MSFLDSLLERLGLRRIERRRYTLDGPLVEYVEALAEHESAGNAIWQPTRLIAGCRSHSVSKKLPH